MTIDQEELIEAARKNIKGAKAMMDVELYGIAASRAYYAMFYVAQAFLLEKGLAFS
ncbi:MAG: HEPN domain-containing protein [Calditrichaeota bacterium]|nr:HEPN domain-containing protein [Calditrichota bacterium]